MKKYLSILMLHVRTTFYKILLIFAVLFGTQFILLFNGLRRLLEMWKLDNAHYLSLDVLIEESKLHFLFLAAFLLITVVLTLNGFEFKEKISYTIRRLSVPEKHYFLLQGFYNSMIYLLLFLTEITIIAAFAYFYKKMVPDIFYSNQTLFLTFYTNDFLHSLLPLEETIRVVRNIILIPAFGFACAYQSYTQRRGRKQWMLLLLTFVTVLNFKSALGTFIGDAFLITVSACMMLLIGYKILKWGNGYEI